MRPTFSLLFVLSFGLVSVFAGRLAAQAERPQAGPPTTTVQAGQVPTESDIYCAGFFTHRAIDPGLVILGGEAGGFQNEFADREFVYLSKGRGWITAPEGQYIVVRPVKDINPREWFPGQHKLILGMGTLYAEIARIQVRVVHEGSATAEVLSACEPIIPGDIAILLTVRPAPPFKAVQTFDPFAPSTGKPTGLIVAGKEFQQAVGKGNVVYLDVGRNQGAQVGSYFRIFRTYLSEDKDIFQRATRNYATEVRGMRLGRKLTRQERASLPRAVLGELLILSVEEGTATGIITLSREDIYPGDEVEME